MGEYENGVGGKWREWDAAKAVGNDASEVKSVRSGRSHWYCGHGAAARTAFHVVLKKSQDEEVMENKIRQ